MIVACAPQRQRRLQRFALFTSAPPLFRTSLLFLFFTFLGRSRCTKRAGSTAARCSRRRVLFRTTLNILLTFFARWFAGQVEHYYDQTITETWIRCAFLPLSMFFVLVVFQMCRVWLFCHAILHVLSIWVCFCLDVWHFLLLCLASLIVWNRLWSRACTTRCIFKNGRFLCDVLNHSITIFTTIQYNYLIMSDVFRIQYIRAKFYWSVLKNVSEMWH